MLRDLTSNDMPAILDLAREMHREGVYAAYPMDENRVAYIVQALIDEPRAFAKGYEIKGELVGAFLGEVIQDLWIDVMVGVDHSFFVRAADRGSRAGVVLLKAFEAWAVENGADVLRPVVYAGVDNGHASAILTRMGYSASGTVHSKRAA